MFTAVITKILAKARNCAYAAHTAGTIAAAFAVMAPVLVGATGTALDLGQSFLVRQRLAGALDAAALAATAAEFEEEAIQERVNDFMEANYPANKIGTLIIESIDVSIDGDDVTVEASAEYQTSFMRVLGIDTLTVYASTTIHKSIKGLEAVLVMDNTGSMGETNMAHLRTAATNFVEIMFERAAEPTDVKIGLVPYSSSVRIGYYGLGKIPNDEEYDTNGAGGTYASYGGGTVFVTLPSSVSYITTSDRQAAVDADEADEVDDASDEGEGDEEDADNLINNGWYGCVIERSPSVNYSSSATHVTNSRGQLWSTSGTAGACTSSTNCRGHGWDPGSSSNNPYNTDTFDNYAGPWDIYMNGNIIDSGVECDDTTGGSDRYYTNARCSNCTGTGGNCASNRCFCSHYDPSASCPWAYIQPLTSDEDKLLDVIDSMKHEGSTYSNIGMAWGMRLISQAAPFTEGAAWTDVNWKKAVIIMTDGEMSPSGTYSGYWDSSKVGSADDVSTMNDRLKETCTFLKNKGVTVYAVNFKHATSDITDTTKQVYKDCASDPDEDYYKFVTTGEELNATFEEIAAALSRLHVAR